MYLIVMSVGLATVLPFLHVRGHVEAFAGTTTSVFIHKHTNCTARINAVFPIETALYCEVPPCKSIWESHEVIPILLHA
jgi:hypothetical protein